MQIQNGVYQPNFQAKFLYSDSLKQIADYAVEHGKFDKLNTARKIIDSASYRNVRKRILVDIGKTSNDRPTLILTSLTPKRHSRIANSLDDYRVLNEITYESSQKMNPLKFALDKIIKLSKSAPENRMYKTLFA